MLMIDTEFNHFEGFNICLRLVFPYLIPGPCSGKKFDINFGNRLHIFKRKEALLFSFEYNLLPNLISNFNHYMDMAL